MHNSMKKVIGLSGLISLLATTECVVSEGRGHGYYRGHERYERHDEIYLGPPVVEVRPPVIIVR